jgi:choice-of-anchor A domain-containing protein
MRSTLAAMLAVTALASSAFGASVLNDWNLIVRTNLNGTSEVDGSALIGGNVSGATNYSVQGVTASSGDGLAVGGNISSGASVRINHGGNLRIGGSVLGTRILNGGGSQINDAGVSSLVSSAFAEVVALQASLGALTANGSIDGAGNMNASPTDMNGSNVAVYAFNISTIQGLGQLNLNFGSADTVVLNVTSNTGAINLVAPPNLLGGFSQSNSSRIIWNFLDATDISVNNTFNGALLATNADLKVLGGGVNGSVVVNSVSALNAEIRRFNYNGWLPESDPSIIPLPGAGAMGFAGVLALGARRRRAI